LRRRALRMYDDVIARQMPHSPTATERKV
jgi:hypothetical protein